LDRRGKKVGFAPVADCVLHPIQFTCEEMVGSFDPDQFFGQGCPLDGRFYLLMKSSLVSVQRKTGVPMPADYGQLLSTVELDDLVGYFVREASGLDSPSSPSGKY